MIYSGDEQFVGEICIFGFNFPPIGWAYCDGQLLIVSQNTALYSLLGTYYGGDGRYTFALPNMQGRCPIHQGQGSGLVSRFLGETGGLETIVLQEYEIPQHTHAIQASIKTGTGTLTANAIGAYPAASAATNLYTNSASGNNIAPLNLDVSIVASGNSQPHNNMQPYLTINFCIALQGIFPPRP